MIKMSMISAELGLRLIYVFGITNILFLVLVLLSCRCMGVPQITEKLFQSEKFKRFYKYHCYFWWGFILSVVLHTLFAFYFLGSPF